MSTDGGTVGVGRATTGQWSRLSIVVIIADFSWLVRFNISSECRLSTSKKLVFSGRTNKRSVRDPSDDAAQSTFAEVDNKTDTPAIEFRDVYLSSTISRFSRPELQGQRGETKIIRWIWRGKSTIIKLVLGF